jgi:hypothetical protein
MGSFLIVAWLFLMVTFCVLGGACALGSTVRKAVSGERGRCGGHIRAAADGTRVLKRRVEARRAETEKSADFEAQRPLTREARLKALASGFVDGSLTVEQYEKEVDRVLGIAM